MPPKEKHRSEESSDYQESSQNDDDDSDYSMYEEDGDEDDSLVGDETEDDGSKESSLIDGNDEPDSILNDMPSNEAASVFARQEFTRPQLGLDDSTALKEVVLPGRIWHDKNLTVVQKVENLLNAAKSIKALPPIGTLYSRTLQNITAESTQSRRYKVQRRKQASSNLRFVHHAGDPFLDWRNRARYPAYTIDMLHIKDGSQAIRYSIPRTSVGAADLERPKTLKLFAAALEKMTNAWPYSLPGKKSLFVRQTFVQAALLAAGGGQPTFYTPRTKDSSGIGVTIPYIDETTGEMANLQERSKQGFIIARPLSMPAHIDFIDQPKFGAPITVAKTTVNGVTTWASLVPSNILSQPAFEKVENKPTVAALRGREEFYRFVAYKLTGLITTPEKLRRMIAHMEVVYGRDFTSERSRRFPAIPGFAYFVEDTRNPGSMLLRIPPSVCTTLNIKAGVKGKHFTVNTTDGRRLARIIDVVSQTLIVSFDFVEALVVLAREIDKTHAAIEADLPVPPLCNCSPSERTTTRHFCTLCCNDFTCAELFVGRSGTRRCLECDSAAHTPFRVDIVELSLKRGAAAALEKEFKKANLATDTAYYKELCDELQQAILSRQQPFTTDQYRDEYLQKVVKYSAGFNPFRPSVEAVHPFGRREADGAILRHTVDNTIVTAVGLNLWHYTFHIGMLQEALTYARSPKRAQDEEHLVQRVQDMMQLAQTFPAAQLTRFQKLTQDEYDVRRYEYITGRPLKPRSVETTSIGAHSMLGSYKSVASAVCHWTSAQKTTIKRICLQIQSAYGDSEVFDTAPDGALWPPQWGPMPSYWSWKVCYTWSNQHLITWRDHCNAPWATEDNQLTLWVETIRQLHDATRLDGLRLGLPLRPWRQQILSPSFAHIPGDHGRQMLTGWPAEPTSFGDWNSKVCSVILMSTFDNRLDFTWKTEHLAEIEDRWIKGKWNVPLQWYNPSAPPPEHLKDLILRRRAKVMEEEEVVSDIPQLHSEHDDHREENDVRSLPPDDLSAEQLAASINDHADGRLIQLGLAVDPKPHAKRSVLSDTNKLVFNRLEQLEHDWNVLRRHLESSDYPDLASAIKLQVIADMDAVLERLREFVGPLYLYPSISTGYDHISKRFSYSIEGYPTQQQLDLVTPHRYLLAIANLMVVEYSLPPWVDSL